MARLFVYGTLRDRARVRALTGRTLPERPARLAGHRRVELPSGYPTVVPDPAASVEGALLDDVEPDALASFDAYEDEGRLYVREETLVTCEGASVRCWVYRASAGPAGTPIRASGA